MASPAPKHLSEPVPQRKQQTNNSSSPADTYIPSLQLITYLIAHLMTYRLQLALATSLNSRK